MRRLFNPKLWIPLLVVVLLAAFTLVGWLSTTPDFVASTKNELDGESAVVMPRDAPSSASGTTDEGSATTTEDLAAAVPPAPSSANRYLLRNGDLSLLVTRGTLLQTVQRLTGITTDLDGYVLSSSLNSETPYEPMIRGSEPTAVPETKPIDETLNVSPAVSTATDSNAPTQAWLTLRVPESRFEAAMERFADLGEVKSVSTSSEDVTAQYVDLNARLRHYRAVERRLLRFLAASSTIREMLVVQDRLDSVQLTIEQLEAQLKSLRETTAYSTVTITLAEKGTPQAGAIDPSDTFTSVLMTSLRMLAHGARVVALAVTAALPFVVVLGGLAAATWYVVRRWRRRHAEQPSVPA